MRKTRSLPGLRSDAIRQAAESLADRYGTRDPFLLCRAMNIHIVPLNTPGKLCGFYRIIKRNRYLFLNHSLSPEDRRVVCAHELGHACLHSAMAKDMPLRAFTVATPSPSEYEANLFAAALLLPKREFSAAVRAGYTVKEIAAHFRVSEELVRLRAEQ